MIITELKVQFYTVMVMNMILRRTCSSSRLIPFFKTQKEVV